MRSGRFRVCFPAPRLANGLANALALEAAALAKPAWKGKPTPGLEPGTPSLRALIACRGRAGAVARSRIAPRNRHRRRGGLRPGTAETWTPRRPRTGSSFAAPRLGRPGAPRSVGASAGSGRHHAGAPGSPIPRFRYSSSEMSSVRSATISGRDPSYALDQMRGRGSRKDGGRRRCSHGSAGPRENLRGG
jgi:hypothetical protein